MRTNTTGSICNLHAHRPKNIKRLTYDILWTNGGKAPHIRNFCTKSWWVLSLTSRFVLPLGLKPQKLIGLEAGWAPEPAWIECRREKCLHMPGIECRSSRLFFSRYAHWAMAAPESIYHHHILIKASHIVMLLWSRNKTPPFACHKGFTRWDRHTIVIKNSHTDISLLSKNHTLVFLTRIHIPSSHCYQP
jgi:hypothetical protein